VLPFGSRMTPCNNRQATMAIASSYPTKTVIGKMGGHYHQRWIGTT
jgi:hypothetical protein